MKFITVVFILLFLFTGLSSSSNSLFFVSEDILLPSGSTGGGNLAVRVTFPIGTAEYRFESGSPILVQSCGGHKTGSLSPSLGIVAQGFAVVNFLYPGGVESGFSSDGVYDYRGEDCVAALRDVTRFALGLEQDTLGRTIQEIVPGTVLTDNVGILSSSNGGPTTTSTLGVHATELSGVKYLVYFESPTNDQTVCCDIGNNGMDCDDDYDGDGNGHTQDDAKNMKYIAYDSHSCTVDYTTMIFDTTIPVTYFDPAELYPPVSFDGRLLLDNNLNGTLDSVDTPPCYDVDGNGRLDVYEDYPFNAKTTFLGPGLIKLYFSTEVTAAAQVLNIFGGSWPIFIATPPETVDFWYWRDATLHFATVASEFPDIGVLLAFRQNDHAQAADDHPHIQQTYDGYQTGGTWCRLNPDYTYIEYVSGTTPPPGTQDNDANIPVIPGTMKSYAEPVDVGTGDIAGVCEMADRVQYQRWETNLDDIITPITTPTPGLTASPAITTTPSATPVLYMVSMMHAEESLPFHADQELFLRYAHNLRILSDFMIGQGAKLDFGPDWKFIEGVKLWDQTLLTDLLAQGHGIHTHAHETIFDLGEVNAKLIEAGLDEDIVANGGFQQTGPGGTNWVGYVAAFSGLFRSQLFEIAIGYKDTSTQIPDGSGFVFRPGVNGDWHIIDPEGPIIYLGSGMPEVILGGNLDFETIRDWIDYRLENLDPEKINTIYWHDSLHDYPTIPAAIERMELWESLLSEHIDPLVAEGKVQWANFVEMGEIYRQTETITIPALTEVGIVLLITALSALIILRRRL